LPRASVTDAAICDVCAFAQAAQSRSATTVADPTSLLNALMADTPM
jgi:hypothetical protein